MRGTGGDRIVPLLLSSQDPALPRGGRIVPIELLLDRAPPVQELPSGATLPRHGKYRYGRLSSSLSSKSASKSRNVAADQTRVSPQRRRVAVVF